MKNWEIKTKVKILILYSFLFSLSLGLPLEVEGVVLYLEPSKGEYHSGDVFIVEARINTEKECINIVEVNISFPPDILEIVDFSQGNSILTLWIKPPKINQELGLVSFSGGIPAGYCGKITGDPQPSNLLGKLIFQTKEFNRGQSSVELEFLESSKVLLNDGLGTPAKLTIKGATFTIFPEKLKFPKNEWQRELEKDIIPPEPFEIEIHQNPTIFEGRYFITFFTTDKQTGIDHYEISETSDEKTENWKKGESPYLLKDQNLKSIIKVKAVDKAGNERIVEYFPQQKPFPYQLIILVLIIGIIIYWLRKKYFT
jgi:hypothetical protein